jgi:hypothetical protein
MINLAYGNLTDDEFNITVSASTAAGFNLNTNLYHDTYFLHFQAQYLALDKDFNYHLNLFTNIPLNYSMGSMVNASTGTGTRTFTNRIHYPTLAGSIGSSFTSFSTNLVRNKALVFVTAIIIDSDNVNDNIIYTVSAEVTAVDRLTLKVIILLKKVNIISRVGYRNHQVFNCCLRS